MTPWRTDTLAGVMADMGEGSGVTLGRGSSRADAASGGLTRPGVDPGHDGRATVDRVEPPEPVPTGRWGRARPGTAPGGRRRSDGRVAQLLLVVVTVLLGVACEVRTEVDVHVDEDGGGRVGVVVLLDEEAAAKVPDLESQLKVDDLEATGWDVTGPEPGDDGGVRIAAEKPFANPGELDSVMTEITGPDGPFREFRVDRGHSFGSTTYRVRGLVDLERGIEAFGDQGLRDVLGGRMFGRPVEVLEMQAGRPLAEAAPFEVTVHLPGGKERSVEPVLGGEPVRLDVESTVRSDRAWFLARAAVVTALVAVVLLWLIATRRIGGRRKPRQYRGLHTIEDDDLYEPPIIRRG